MEEDDAIGEVHTLVCILHNSHELIIASAKEEDVDLNNIEGYFREHFEIEEGERITCDEVQFTIDYYNNGCGDGCVTIIDEDGQGIDVINAMDF